MPLRAFWVILVGKTPTSFRAKLREDLVPTLRQLQRTQDEVSLRWFERGKIWESPQAAEGAAKLAATMARERRSKEWRPGGEHRDPRARFEQTRDQKRAKFKREQRRDRSDAPFDPRAPKAPRPDGPRPGSRRPDGPGPDSTRPRSPRPGGPRPDRPRSPFGHRGPRPENPFKPPKRGS